MTQAKERSMGWLTHTTADSCLWPVMCGAWCVQVGLVHICTFILLKLSGERNFGVALNKVTPPPPQ